MYNTHVLLLRVLEVELVDLMQNESYQYGFF